MSQVPPHKTNFSQYIEPNYGYVKEVNPGQTREKFQAFLDELLALIPDEGAPADGYMYNAHMGSFVRHLDEAKNDFVCAQLAFYAKRGSCQESKKQRTEEK